MFTCLFEECTSTIEHINRFSSVIIFSAIFLILLITWMSRKDALSQFYKNQPCPARRAEPFSWLPGLSIVYLLVYHCVLCSLQFIMKHRTLICLGRNETFLKHSIRYSMSIQRDGPLISIIPNFLKPILAPFITWSGKRDCEICINILLPLVQQRLEGYTRNRNDGAWIPPVRTITSLSLMEPLIQLVAFNIRTTYYNGS